MEPAPSLFHEEGFQSLFSENLNKEERAEHKRGTLTPLKPQKIAEHKKRGLTGEMPGEWLKEEPQRGVPGRECEKKVGGGGSTDVVGGKEKGQNESGRPKSN